MKNKLKINLIEDKTKNRQRICCAKNQSVELIEINFMNNFKDLPPYMKRSIGDMVYRYCMNELNRTTPYQTVNDSYEITENYNGFNRL